jgi:hypothetical protein
MPSGEFAQSEKDKETFEREVNPLCIVVIVYNLVVKIRDTVRNNSTRLRRIWVRLQGTSSSANRKIRVSGYDAVDVHKEKQDVELIFSGTLKLF